MKKFFTFLSIASLSTLSAIAGVADPLKGNLQQIEKGKLAPYTDDAKLDGVKTLALYFSASWCGPCRNFTPKLVQFYNRVKRSNPQFELVFISRDRDADAMVEYMKGDRMPWPAVPFDTKTSFSKYGGRGIPCLVVLDENGSVIIDSYDGQKYLGAEDAMERLGKLLSKERAEKKKAGSDFDSLFKPRGASAAQ